MDHLSTGLIPRPPPTTGIGLNIKAVLWVFSEPLKIMFSPAVNDGAAQTWSSSSINNTITVGNQRYVSPI